MSGRLRFVIVPRRSCSTEPKSGDSRPPAVSALPRLVAHPHLVVLEHGRSPWAERFRRICAQLERGRAEAKHPRQIIAVTSAVPNEGKTTVALNLALALAEHRDERVLLVDLDLRRPSTANYIEPRPELGLADALAGSIHLDDALIRVKNARLTVLPAGTDSAQPLELLRSRPLASLLATFRKSYRWIVIDAPPVVPFADAGVIQALCDGLLLVVRAGSTAVSLIDSALDDLAGDKLLGAVLNDVRPTPIERYYSSYEIDSNAYDDR